MRRSGVPAVLRVRRLESGVEAARRLGRARPTSTRDVWEPVRTELARARRFDREFAIVRIPARIEEELAPRLRDIDRTWVAFDATYVLLPEAGRDAGRALVDRLRREEPDLLPATGVAVAAFPSDGLTSGAIIGALAATEGRARGNGLSVTPPERRMIHA